MSHVRELSIKCEKWDLFITPLSRYLTALKFIETKERKNMLKKYQIKQYAYERLNLFEENT